MIGLLFPGQGAQTPGFLHALPAHPAVARTLAEASDVFGRPILELDDAAALASTRAVQVGLLTAGVACARALAEEGVAAGAVAGLSVGAFAAAVACGALDFASALRLVDLRGALMENAYPAGFGMTVIAGLNEAEVSDVLAASGGEAYLANLNAPRQIVIAGSDASLAAASAAARARGARKTERLDVAVPSHCELLAPAAVRLAEAAAQLPFAAPRVPYIANRHARPCRTAAAVRDDLAGNLRYPVRWHDATRLMFELGVRVFIEAAPGHALSDLAAEAFPCASVLTLSTLAPAEAARAAHARTPR